MPGINVDDRVQHKKYGLGTVKQTYAKNDAARVEYDSGHVTVNAQKRLKVVPAGWGEAKTEQAEEEPRKSPELQDVKATRRGGSGTSRVDYKLLERAQQHIARQYPDAHKIQPGLYNGRAYCTVYESDGSGKVVFYVER
jgi:hypothetical protein